MLLSWDDRKNEANFRKHGVWFEEAQEVIFHPLSLIAPNAHPSGERWEYLGPSGRLRILYIVTRERDPEEIRLLSARRAAAKERKRYEGI